MENVSFIAALRLVSHTQKENLNHPSTINYHHSITESMERMVQFFPWSPTDMTKLSDNWTFPNHTYKTAQQQNVQLGDYPTFMNPNISFDG